MIEYLVSAFNAVNMDLSRPYPRNLLGQPSKLSWGNQGTRCFACEERRVAFELVAAAKSKTANRWREARRPLREGG